MSKIYELLKNEKVEWKKLGEVCEIKTGKLNANAKVENGRYLFFTTAKEISYIDEYAFEGESLLVAGNANIGDVKYYFGKFNAYQRVYVLQNFNNINAIFLMHFMKKNLKNYLQSKKKQAAMTYIILKDLEEFQIPIPSLETQEKIVKILDKFTNHVTELQAELQARNKQYEYYRDMLLSEEYLNYKSRILFIENNNSIKKCKLKDIAKITRGKRLVRSNLEESGKYPVFQNSLKPLGYYHDKNFSGDKACVISAGAAGEIFYREGDFWAADDVFVIDSDSILNKYIYYFLLSKQSLIKTKVRKASVPRLSRDEIERLDIVFPNMELQNKVVEVLDKFQDLLSDTQGLLPEEIEQRQKQYEYYREKLLTFEDKSDSKPQAASRKPQNNS